MAKDRTAAVEILCPSCGVDALLRREPVYEGFKKVGERLFCSACGHEFEGEAGVGLRPRAKPAVFGDEDRTHTVDVFKDDEKGRTCRHCRHYVVNPFTQRCGLHNRVVEATDACGDFEKREDTENGRRKTEDAHESP